MNRKMHLNLFINSRGHHEASWRHPDSSPLALTDIAYYRELAQRAEANREKRRLAKVATLLCAIRARRAEEGRGAEGLGVIGWTSLISGAFAVGPMHSDEWGDLMDRWAIPSVIAVVVFGVHGAIVGAYNRGGRAPVPVGPVQVLDDGR